MPIYEYKCSSCGKKFEKIEKFSDSPLETHEECGGAVERLLSAPALQFKGTGWYITDYARGNGGADAKNGSEAKKQTSTESKAESNKSASTNSNPSSSTTRSSTSTSSEKK
jgi:putative FmdB family regulatory protein